MRVKWKTFINDWGRYKSSQNVTRTVDIHNELLSCCSEEVRENLDWARGVKIDNLDEKALITAIKKAAVYSISKSIHRRNFHQMNQKADKNFDHKRAEYKNQQAAGQRGGETSKKFETGSKGKCTDCNKTFDNVISVRGKQMLIHKCQTCFKKSARCKKCDETGHRQQYCKKSSQMSTKEGSASESDSGPESENGDNVRDRNHSRTKSSKSGKSGKISHIVFGTILRRSNLERQTCENTREDESDDSDSESENESEPEDEPSIDTRESESDESESESCPVRGGEMPFP